MNRYKPRIAAFAIALALSACVTTPQGLQLSPTLSSVLDKFGTFTLADIDNADAMAARQVQTDRVKMDRTCFAAMRVFVGNQQQIVGALKANTVSGAISAFEAARIGAGDLQAQAIDAQIIPLENGCAPMIQDSKRDVAGFLGELAKLFGGGGL